VTGDRESVVAVHGLYVRLRYEHDRVRSLREYIVRRLQHALIASEWIDVLVGVSFEIKRGELLAVLGPNGAGKTTLLRVLAGIVPADEGRVEVRGRVAPLIDLGAGFDPELTGSENVELFATILGLSLAEVRRRMPAIRAFADLGDALDVPLRNYSSGMVARLGFAVATETAPSVLLVDEALAVGDEEFRSRCFTRIDRMRAGGTAIVLVSHDLPLVQARADRALLLRDGRQVALGPPADVIEQYLRGVSP